MAFLEADAKNISSGWPAPQSLSAPNIGETLSAILRNRIAQQQQTQEAISAAIKAQQSRSQDAAFAQAMQNTGLSEGQDFSGLSGAQMARMAQLLADRTPDTDEDKLKQAQANYYNARADDTGSVDDGTGFGSTDFDQQYPAVRTNQYGIQEYRKVTKGAHGQLIVNYQPYSTTIQPTPVQQQSTRQTFQTEKDIEKQIDDLQLWRKIQEQQDIKAQRPNVPFARQTEEDQLRKQLEDVRARRAAPQPSPAETGDALPTPTPIPNGKGADKNLAPGYGVPVDDVRRARARQAMDDPDATPAEKEQARRILAGE